MTILEIMIALIIQLILLYAVIQGATDTKRRDMQMKTLITLLKLMAKNQGVKQEDVDKINAKGKWTIKL